MKWISVEEKLPPTSGLYLVVADWMGVIEKAEFDKNDKWHSFSSPFDPTHWMPLPELPENGDKE
jgi:hypothetical protein